MLGTVEGGKGTGGGEVATLMSPLLDPREPGLHLSTGTCLLFAWGPRERGRGGGSVSF